MKPRFTFAKDRSAGIVRLSGFAALLLCGAALLGVTGCGRIEKKIRLAKALKTVYVSGHRYRTFFMPSGAMRPTIVPDKSTLIVDLSIYETRAPKRGDIVTFTPPEVSSNVYIKRIIGLPGDRVSIEHGQVAVNGGPATGLPASSQPAYSLETRGRSFVVDGVPLDTREASLPDAAHWPNPDRLPPQCYLVLGDEVNDSEDSHIWGCAQFSGTFFSGALKGKPVGAPGVVVSIVDDP